MAYTHGGDIYRNPVELDFSVNINPLGMPFQSMEAAKKGVMLSAAHYPDCYSEELCRALAGFHGVKVSQVIPGNGAAELLFALCQFLRPQKGLILAPSFQGYEEALTGAGAEIRAWELEETEGFAVTEDFISSVRGEEGILFYCNPSNPAGNLTEKRFLYKLAKRCEETDTWLCLDECFLPFLGPDREREVTMMQELKHFPHLIVLRAFTKIYAMPGLRLGYACSANSWLTEGLRRVLQPWNISIPAQMAGIAALKDREYLEKTFQIIAEEKKYLEESLLDGLVLKLYPSAANYLFFKAQKGLKEKLLEKGVLIRSCGDFRNLSEGYFRIAVKTHRENEALICRWRECYGKINYDTGDNV
ncbi:aminotransferase class I/II-fold pyridoxal phosphate-dependent enzyme [bacterium D16-51]|nr:aminotransferase class I/II-fold pyridoxal phosphate-dependent enzyme [bacterium D16-59]RKI58914.1 aminotransferase class I/II-fold pyridoxal phosphate-dependent enzyme [bacterium D16-51]